MAASVAAPGGVPARALPSCSASAISGVFPLTTDGNIIRHERQKQFDHILADGACPPTQRAALEAAAQTAP